MSEETKTGNYKVDSEVKRKFLSAANYKGVDSNRAIEEAMQLFTEKYIAEPVHNETLLKALS
jgi:hypothetical protein